MSYSSDRNRNQLPRSQRYDPPGQRHDKTHSKQKSATINASLTNTLPPYNDSTHIYMVIPNLKRYAGFIRISTKYFLIWPVVWTLVRLR